MNSVINRDYQFVQSVTGGFTLIELMLTLAVAGVLYAIAVPAYTSYRVRGQDTQAIAEISTLSLDIEHYRTDNYGKLPATLADLGIPIPKDPWGHNYYYNPLEGTHANPSNARWDKNLRPINIDYDLYSAGADGKTKQKITQRESLDDIIRANGGSYVGLARDY